MTPPVPLPPTNPPTAPCPDTLTWLVKDFVMVPKLKPTRPPTKSMPLILPPITPTLLMVPALLPKMPTAWRPAEMKMLLIV